MQFACISFCQGVIYIFSQRVSRSQSHHRLNMDKVTFITGNGMNHFQINSENIRHFYIHYYQKGELGLQAQLQSDIYIRSYRASNLLWLW